MQRTQGKPKFLPERFVLLPTAGGALQVMHAAQCVGYLWLEGDKWRARDDAGALVGATATDTVHGVLSSLFAARREQVFSRALFFEGAVTAG